MTVQISDMSALVLGRASRARDPGHVTSPTRWRPNRISPFLCPGRPRGENQGGQGVSKQGKQGKQAGQTCQTTRFDKGQAGALAGSKGTLLPAWIPTYIPIHSRTFGMYEVCSHIATAATAAAAVQPMGPPPCPECVVCRWGTASTKSH